MPEKEKIGCEIPCNMTGEYNLGSNTPSSHPLDINGGKLISDDSDQGKSEICMDVNGLLGQVE